MKRIMCLLLAVLLLQSFAVMASAQNPVCSITADTVAYTGGEEVAVPVRIGDNPGFTNFAMELTYDPRKLELVRIDRLLEGNPCLCPETVGINSGWKQEAHQASALVIAASAEAVTGDGVLFVAVFRVLDPAGGSAAVKAKASYIRNNTALFPAFEDISATETEGGILIPLKGDLNGDGMVDQADVSLIYSAYLGEAALTEEQMTMADANGDSIIEYDEVMKIYQFMWRDHP